MDEENFEVVHIGTGKELELKFDAGKVLGLKFDDGKLRYDLMPPVAVEAWVQNLTIGAAKYGAGNWAFVDNGIERYKAALLRHMFAYMSGERTDKDGFHHLGAVMSCAAFIIELEKKNG